MSPTDRSKSVCNCCVIEVFVAFFMLSRCFFDFSVVVGAFVVRLSQISSFFPLRKNHIRLGMSIFRICQGITLVSTDTIS